MTVKKTSPAKPSRPSGVKTIAKKITVKKASVKKTVVTQKAVSSVKKKTTAKKITVKKSAAKKIAVKKTAPVKKTIKSNKTVNTKKATAKSAPVKSAVQLLVDAAVDGILEIKGKNISILDLRGIHNRVCDYYIICQADSSTQVNAIAGSVEVMVKKRIGERPYHSEGFQNSEWVLVDYVTVVVHVFQSHIREFYKLEALWADAEVTKIAFD
jgi:ribosome-associated protein